MSDYVWLFLVSSG